MFETSRSLCELSSIAELKVQEGSGLALKYHVFLVVKKLHCHDSILPSKEKRISKEEDAKNRGENGLHRSVGRNKNWATLVI